MVEFSVLDGFWGCFRVFRLLLQIFFFWFFQRFLDGYKVVSGVVFCVLLVVFRVGFLFVST